MSEVAASGPGEMMGNAGPGMLAGLRVIEIADERAEYTGLLLAGLGAEVIKIEPPEGNATRRIGPFLDDQPGLERSLFFWNYNRNKKSVVLDLQSRDGREHMLRLLGGADILLDASCGALNEVLGLDHAALNARFPQLVTARMTPFGDDGPWKDFKGSDLIHLALGGPMMNCGYDPDPNFEYDTPPIAPQIWHAYHIAGEQMATGIIAALIHRERSGEGQDVSLAIHEAVSKNPEQDLMYWVCRRVPLWRLTCRHASEGPNHSPSICHTKDGRWFITHGMGARDLKNLVPLLGKYNAQADLQPPAPEVDLRARQVPGTAGSDEARSHMLDVVQRFVRAWTYKDMPWLEAQNAGLLWAPLRKPHENALDEHWLARKTFAEIEHPELGRSLPLSDQQMAQQQDELAGRPPRAAAWARTPTAVLGEAARRPSVPAQPRRVENPRLSALHNKPFPLQGIKIFDFAWFLASAGGTRFLAAMGAESYKVEWKDNPDTRLAGMAPVGGRAARDAATGPLPGVRDPDMGGNFLNKNSGKRGISLNIRHPKGLQIAKDMIRICDVVAEGFSPGVLQRLGLGYDVLKSIRPDIIYIQQSGMGAHGTYGRMRTVGPVAAAFGGQAEMSGLPEPAMPVSWGYSFLDWMGAYGYALALLGAIYHRERTGEGQWIDASQCESGIFLTGATILDWAANDRVLPPLRQPLAVQAGGAARRLSLRGQGPLDRDRLLHRRSNGGRWRASPSAATGSTTAASRRSTAGLQHQDALDAAVEGLDPHPGPLRLHDEIAEGRACRPGCARTPRTASTPTRSSATSNG